MENEIKYERGQVYYVRFDSSVGSEMAVGRAALIVSNQGDIDEMDTVICVYITTGLKKSRNVVKVFFNGRTQYVHCSQVQTLDKVRLKDYLGDLSQKDMMRVSNACALAMSYNRVLPKQVGVDSEPKNAELEMKLEIYRGLYEKAVKEIVDLRFELDTKPVKKQELSEEEILELIDSLEKPEKQEVKLSEVHPVMEPPKTEKIAEPIKEVGEAARVLDVDVDKLKTAMGAIPKTEPEKKSGRGAVKKHGLSAKSKPEEFIPYKTGDTANVNTDDWWVIVANTGLPIQTAQNITAYRKKHGKFVDLVDLLNVTRFGVKHLNKYGNKLEV